MQTSKSRSVSLFLSVLVLLPTGICLSQVQEEGPATGELKLEGKHIQRLIFMDKKSKREKYENPGESIKLPAGEYQLREIHLEGGYISRYSGRWTTVDKDKQNVLKVGAPLKQSVKAKRRANLLVLDYELLGVGGRKYVQARRGAPPQFAIYRGDKKIASDKFEFG
ncbi:MAG: hypothetical protein GWN67_21170 [Phycisphaerae bacterium]|nr:hypothetical protein [Phycisphaerae bacterium]NIU58798.1 hypothetical protein [Phycisphaerae bacterium]NIW95071.1 hypothetical protein [Phycisphaerae bacterium]